MEISRLTELKPNWDLPKADEPGFMRNLWVHVDEETGGDNSMLGVVHQPPGNGIPGLHKHEAEETYFVLEGTAAFWTDTDDEVIVEQHESAFFPSQEKHAYRNAGTEDLLLLFALAGSEAAIKKENDLGYEVEERYDV